MYRDSASDHAACRLDGRVGLGAACHFVAQIVLNKLAASKVACSGRSNVDGTATVGPPWRNNEAYPIVKTKMRSN